MAADSPTSPVLAAPAASGSSKKCVSFASQAQNLIQIQQPSETGDSAGDVSASWSTILTCYAVIIPVKGYEALMSQQLQSAHTHKVRIRYTSLLMPPPVGVKCRILFGSRVFNITALRNIDEENRFIEMLVDEGVAT